MPPRVTTPLTEITSETMQLCFEQVLPELHALPAETIKKPRVNVAAAAGLVIAAMNRAQPHLEELARTFPGEATVIQDLPIRAFAMLHAWVDNATAPAETTELPALVEDGLALRKRLLAAADLLVGEHILPAANVATIRAGSGHLDVGTDLMELALLLGRYPDDLAATAPRTAALLPEANRLGLAIFLAYGRKKQPKGDDTPAEQLRDRAYTHFLNAYEETRHQLAYLRRNQRDADRILPSIFTPLRR